MWDCVCPGRRQWHPTPVLLPGKSHGRRRLGGCSPWGQEESDTTERLHFHFPLSCTGEGNGNPLQCSCLENPRDGGAWWAPSIGAHRARHDWSDLAAAECALAPRLSGRPLAAPTTRTGSHPGLPLPLHYKPPALLQWGTGSHLPVSTGRLPAGTPQVLWAHVCQAVWQCHLPPCLQALWTSAVFYQPLYLPPASAWGIRDTQSWGRGRKGRRERERKGKAASPGGQETLQSPRCHEARRPEDARGLRSGSPWLPQLALQGIADVNSRWLWPGNASCLSQPQDRSLRNGNAQPSGFIKGRLTGTWTREGHKTETVKGYSLRVP